MTRRNGLLALSVAAAMAVLVAPPRYARSTRNAMEALAAVGGALRPGPSTRRGYIVPFIDAEKKANAKKRKKMKRGPHQGARECYRRRIGGFHRLAAA